MPGGPQTPAGKAVARQNALRHGLTASTLLPDILGAGLVEQAYQQLLVEWQPASPTEEYFVRELARHQVALQRIEQIEGAVLRQGARGATQAPLGALLSAGTPPEEYADVLLAAAGTTHAVDKVARYRRKHERAVQESLKFLQQLREQRAARPGAEAPTRACAPRTFRTEAACEAYLAERWQAGCCRCPHCGGATGEILAPRPLWQCGHCRRQSSLRAGTVMARSRVSLRAWFGLIARLLREPAATTQQLAQASGLNRAATVRTLAERIRRALDAVDVSDQLAGLNDLFARRG